MKISYAVGLAVLLAVTTVRTVLAEDQEKSLSEKREELRKRCQQVIPKVQHMPSKQRQEMASLIGKIDAELTGADRILSGRVPTIPPPDTVVRQFLDDGNFFLDDVVRCVEATKKKKACSVSRDSQGWISENPQYLRDLPTYCQK